MSPKIYLDEDVNPLLAYDLRQRGYQVEAPSEIGRLGLSDREQLDYALRQGRAILTHNRDDFLALAREYAIKQIPHNGILYVPQVPYGELLRRVANFLATTEATQVQNAFVWIP